MGRPTAYSVNEEVFFLQTDEAHYWIGFLMADGSIYRREPHHQACVKIALHAQDKEHLERFKLFVQTEQPIRYYTTNKGKTPVAEISVRSEKIAQCLASFGVVENKSHVARVVGLEQDRHFWRGVIDGDGWVGTPGKNKGLELVGARTLLEQFCQWCEQFELGPLPKATPHKSIYRVRLPQRYVVPVLSLLYQEQDVCLKRKYDRAMQILPYHNPSNSVKPFR